MSRDNKKVAQLPVKRSFAFQWEKAVLGSDLPDGVKLTAWTLRTFANPNGEQIFPSQAAIAERRRRTDRTIRKHLPRLEQEGWITIKKSGGPPAKGGRTDSYRLLIPESAETQSSALSSNPQHQSAEHKASALSTEVRKSGAEVRKTAVHESAEPMGSYVPISTNHINQGEGAGAEGRPPSSERNLSRDEWKVHESAIKEVAEVLKRSEGDPDDQELRDLTEQKLGKAISDSLWTSLCRSTNTRREL